MKKTKIEMFLLFIEFIDKMKMVHTALFESNMTKCLLFKT